MPYRPNNPVMDYSTNIMNLVTEKPEWNMKPFMLGESESIPSIGAIAKTRRLAGGGSRRKLFMGIELETVINSTYTNDDDEECQDDDLFYENTKAIISALDTAAGAGFAIAKYDGSLPTNGVEFVTLPATLSKHLEVWGKALPVLRKYSEAYAYRSCGMHIHINTNCLTPLQQAKLLVFLNNASNEPLLRYIAQRDYRSNMYCHSNDSIKPSHVKYKRGSVEYYALRDHHLAATLSTRNKGSTIELRLFKANISTLGFIKNLEFTAALVDFVKEASCHTLIHASNADKIKYAEAGKNMFSGMSSEDFIKWFNKQENSGRYPALREFMSRRINTAQDKPRTELQVRHIQQKYGSIAA